MACPRVKKMNVYLKPFLFSNGMKKDIINYVARCLEYQQVKDEHRHPVGLLQQHAIPELKREVISMDFIIILLMELRRHNFFIVVVDTLTQVFFRGET
jgi:hypothetical protein